MWPKRTKFSLHSRHCETDKQHWLHTWSEEHEHNLLCFGKEKECRKIKDSFPWTRYWFWESYVNKILQIANGKSWIPFSLAETIFITKHNPLLPPPTLTFFFGGWRLLEFSSQYFFILYFEWMTKQGKINNEY